MKQRKFASVKDTLPGPNSRKYMEMSEKYEAQCMGYQAPLVWDKAAGCLVTDVDGNRYIDWTSGVLVTNVGHCHPTLVRAIQESAAKLLNCYDFPTAARVKLVKKLVESMPDNLDRAFLLSTGSEGIESALRVAKRYTGNYEVISFYGGFHGRTWGGMTAGGLSGIKKKYGPLIPGAIRVPYPYCYRCPLGKDKETCGMACLDFIDTTVRACSTGNLAAVLVEPYQGAAGFVFPPEGWLTKLEQWLRANKLVFILDEVQSSFGRTGKMYALEWENLRPDMVVLGKGIGSGFPLSALVANSKVIGALGKGEMSSTYGGNPVSGDAGLAVFEIFETEKLVERSLKMGEILKQGLLRIQEKCPYLGDVRGRGLVMGLEFVRDKKTKEPAPDITRKVINLAAQKGLLVGSVGVFGNVIRVAPPLVISEEEITESLEIMEEVLTEVH